VYFPVDDNMLRLAASGDLQDRVQVIYSKNVINNVDIIIIITIGI